ncbi:MAG: DUF924 family protein [Burkholderiaceae bacterium]
MNATPHDILQFWFGAPADARVVAERQRKLWWSKNEAVDALVRERFGVAIDAAASGALDGWTATPDGLLALILLTDQFPRNARRGTPGAFGCDPAARRFCRLGLERGDDLALRPIERVFHYLPLEHSESLPDQDEAVRRFAALRDAVPEDDREPFDGYLDFARRHRAVIARFGRFPHRNAILGRASTAEETAFLAQPGSGF